MSRDDVSERILEGDAYDRAAVTVRRAIPLSLSGKVRLAIATLALSTLLAPALFLRRGFIRAVEGTGSLAETLSPTIAFMALLGVVASFAVGLALIGYRHLVDRRNLTRERARRLIRIEDVLAFFLLQGVAFVLIPTVLSLLGVLSTDIVVQFYELDVAVYRPGSPAPVDARVVSAAGGAAAIVLLVTWTLVGSRR